MTKLNMELVLGPIQNSWRWYVSEREYSWVSTRNSWKKISVWGLLLLPRTTRSMTMVWRSASGTETIYDCSTKNFCVSSWVKVTSYKEFRYSQTSSKFKEKSEAEYLFRKTIDHPPRDSSLLCRGASSLLIRRWSI